MRESIRGIRGIVGMPCVVLVLLTVFSPVWAETIVGTGSIDTSAPWTEAASPYILEGDATVRVGDTLTIEPGVTVQINAGVRLVIAGALVARGSTADTPITFTASDSSAPWRNIVFNDSAVDATYDINGNYESGSILEYVIIEFAGIGIQSSELGVVNLINSNPAINQVTLRNNKATAIYAGNASGLLKITNSTIQNNVLVEDTQNKSPAISIRRPSSVSDSLVVEVLNNDISGNSFDSITTRRSKGGGVYIANATSFTIANNTISNNSATDGGAIFLELNNGNTADYVVKNNRIENNTALENGGAINLTKSNVVISNNNIRNNMAGTHSGAVYVNNSEADINDNIMQNNSAGHTGGAVYVEALMPKPPFNLRRNLIIGNHADEHGGGVDIHDAANSVQMTSNLFVSNSATGSGDAIHLAGAGGTVNGNTITGVGESDAIYLGVTYNFTTNTVAGNTDVSALFVNDANSDSAINNNNIFRSDFKADDGVEIENRNSSTTPLNAQNNWWGADVPNSIGQTAVDFSSPLTLPYTGAPVSPPVLINVSETNAGILVRWIPNPEADVAGYQVHWGTDSVYDLALPVPAYDQVHDAGLVQQFTITENYAAGDLYVAVSAYYAIVGADDGNTVVNERMTSGYESWYSQEQRLDVVNSPQSKPPNNGAGGSSGSGGGGGGAVQLFSLVLLLMPLLMRAYSRQALIIKFLFIQSLFIQPLFAQSMAIPKKRLIPELPNQRVSPEQQGAVSELW